MPDEIEVTQGRRIPVSIYRYYVRGDKQEPLGDDESLAWLADQLCSEDRIHPDRTMATGWIPYQAALEFPDLWDRFEALRAQLAEKDALLRELKTAIGTQGHTDWQAVSGAIARID